MSRERKPFPVRLNDEELKIVDDLRRREEDIPTRGEMLRRMVVRRGARIALEKDGATFVIQPSRDQQVQIGYIAACNGISIDQALEIINAGRGHTLLAAVPE